jgi:hypothetical protein
MRKSIIFALLCLLPILISCDKSDNLTDIFLAKTWKMNYIASGSIGKTWYSFTDVTKQNYEDYSSRTKVFTLSFSGMQSEDEISGTFTGSGSLSISGKWSASGNGNRDLKTSEVSSNISDATDIIAQKILYGLQNAKSWKGDQYNLFIYFTYQGETLFMAFTSQE